MTSSDLTLRPLADTDRAWLRGIVAAEWGLPVVSPAGVHDDPSRLEGLVAEVGGERAGAVTYEIVGDECEVVTLDSLVPGRGVGRALMEAVRAAAAAASCRRLWLVTTNENLQGLGFYQRLGLDLVALHRDFVEVVRRHKPDVGSVPVDGIQFRHALELEWPLR